jgi:hypothetical protein
MGMLGYRVAGFARGVAHSAHKKKPRPGDGQGFEFSKKV